VISGIRTFLNKAPPGMDSFDMNEAIRDVILITRGEAEKTGISVEAPSTPRSPTWRCPTSPVATGAFPPAASRAVRAVSSKPAD
jgi:hypothetical protein